MYYINDKGFSYLLFPKKYDADECKGVFKDNVDMLYYYLNRGVPIGDMPMPIYCTQEMVNQYGLDNLVMNMQRKYKYDYDIIVVKVPQDYLRMEPTFGNCGMSDLHKYDHRAYMLPIACRYDFNGQKRDMISADYIDSIYLRYPDCRRVINDNWKLISPDYAGMKNIPFQDEMLAIHGDVNESFISKSRTETLENNNLSTAQICTIHQKAIDDGTVFGCPKALLDYIEYKYRYTERIYKCRMTKSRIENILAVEAQRQDKKDRSKFVGE